MRVSAEFENDGARLADIFVSGIRVLGIRRIDGSYESLPDPEMLVRPLEDLLVYGPGAAYAAMSTDCTRL
jgi:hypothetical protein